MRRLGLLLPLALGCSDQFENGLGGPNAQNRGGYNGAQHCWDLDYDGEADADEDTNGDGVVDVYDCRGDDDGSGSSGSDGQDCWDLDGDGVGDLEEGTNGDGVVDVYDCRDDGDSDTGTSAGDRPYFGDITFHSAEGMLAFCERYDVVYGSVSVSPTLENLDGLACLRMVDGDLDASINSLSTMALPALERVGGSIWVGSSTNGTCDGLSTLSLPLLEEVGGSVEFKRCEVLSTVEFPVLSTIGARFVFSTMDALGSVDAGLLQSVGETVAFTEVPALFDIDLSSLTSAGGVTIQRALNLTSLARFSALTDAGNVSLYEFGGTSLRGLSAVRTTKSLELTGNPSLSDVTDLHGVTHVDGILRIWSNPSLSSTDAQALIDAIGESNVTGTITNEYNGG